MNKVFDAIDGWFGLLGDWVGYSFSRFLFVFAVGFLLFSSSCIGLSAILGLRACPDGYRYVSHTATGFSASGDPVTVVSGECVPQ